MFQANTNAYLKNLETQVGQLALNMQNQSWDSFPCDTKKNPKDCMEITLRSGRELENKEKEKNNQTRNQEKSDTGRDSKLNSSEITIEKVRNQKYGKSSKLGKKN